MNKKDAEGEVLDRTVGQIQDLASAEVPEARPGVAEVAGELDALDLKGGPADEVAFHDFHVLQMAFKNVWAQAFDQSLYSKVEEVYNETVRLYDDAGLPVPDFAAIADVQQLQDFLRSYPVMGAQGSSSAGAIVVPPPPPGPTIPMSPDILTAFPEARFVWTYLREDEKSVLQSSAGVVNTSSDPEAVKGTRQAVAIIVAQCEAKLGRLSALVLDLGVALSEPYAFDVFAPNSYNYGIMLTYRQRWEPLSYQAGDLVATIPLAPGESRKYSRKQVVKTSRAVKEIEKSMRSRAEQSSETGRAEAEIMKRASSSTNFKMTSEGSFNVGIGNISSSTEFVANQANESAGNKKEFHEATIKAAQEFKLERSLEVDTSQTIESEETTSGEISNPNNEITVTYLFYELQRRYQVSEQIHRARPVILVAQDVPAPHEINEAWLLAYQWILGRVLLDDSFRPALQYLASGMAGDEVSNEVTRINFEAQRALVAKLEGEVAAQMTQRQYLRETLVQTGLQISLEQAAEMPTVAKVFTLGLAPDPAAMDVDRLEAQRTAAEARLKYVEEALADAQTKLKSASEALTQATRDYAAAQQRKFSRHVSIDQLRLHVKQNILYYMQAIWDHEPADQRFFRLYTTKVKCPGVPAGTGYSPAPAAPDTALLAAGTVIFELKAPSFTAGDEVDLVDVGDLDNPLGYKGNYMIFPLKNPCPLTTFMLSEFVDEYFGVRDPDTSGAYSVDELEKWLTENLRREDIPAQTKQDMEKLFLAKLGEARPVSDVIIVPTGQLFIEALPGRHPLLEDFKLRHRLEDLHKVKAEVRHAEIENLRLASRLVEGQTKTELLEDPDIEKKVIVQSTAPVVIGTE